MADKQERLSKQDAEEPGGLDGRPVSRRDFLKIAGLAGATIGVGAGLGGLLAACGEEETTTTTAAAATTTTAGMETTTTAGMETTTSVAAGAEAGRPIKIGAVSPITGTYASFGAPDKWIVSYVLAATADGVVCGDGLNHPIEITQLDTQSNPNRVAEVTADLIFNTQIDMMVASSSPDTVNPAAEQCEANGVPFLANFVPWQPFYFGRGATPDTPFTWTWMYHFGVEDAADCRLGMWDQIETNKKVCLLFPNDADGVAWSNKETGLGPILAKGGYEIVSQPEMYQMPAEDFSAQISEFKSSGAEICTGLQSPPDFTNFWKQCIQQDFRPKILAISKAALFHDTMEAVGDIGVGLCDHAVWHPTYPYTSALTGQTCQEYADQYTAETGEQWTQPLGQLGKYEWAVDILKRWPDIEDKSLFPDIVKATVFAGINGPVDFTLPVEMGTVRPVPNVYKIKISGGQWIKLPEGSPYPYDMLTVYGQDPNMPILKEFEAMPYNF
jgi:branched-chain amino acid transport system substrate-binding protein